MVTLPARSDGAITVGSLLDALAALPREAAIFWRHEDEESPSLHSSIEYHAEGISYWGGRLHTPFPVVVIDTGIE